MSERWRQTDRDGGDGGRGLHTFSVVWEKESNLSSQCSLYKLFGLLKIYILYNYFGSIVSDESHSSQVNALN